MHVCEYLRLKSAGEYMQKTDGLICSINTSKLFGLPNCAQSTLQAHNSHPTVFPLAGTCILKIVDFPPPFQTSFLRPFNIYLVE